MSNNEVQEDDDFPVATSSKVVRNQELDAWDQELEEQEEDAGICLSLEAHGWRRQKRFLYLYQGQGWTGLYNHRHLHVRYTIYGALPGAIFAERAVSIEGRVLAPGVAYHAYPVVSLVQHQCGLREGLLPFTTGGRSASMRADPFVYSPHDKKRLLKTETGYRNVSLSHQVYQANLCTWGVQWPVEQWGIEQWGRQLEGDKVYRRHLRLMAHFVPNRHALDQCAYTLRREVAIRRPFGGGYAVLSKGEFVWSLCWSQEGDMSVKVWRGTNCHSELLTRNTYFNQSPDEIALVARRLVAATTTESIDVDAWLEEFRDERIQQHQLQQQQR